MYNKIKPKKLTLAALLIPGVLLFVMCCIVPLGVAFYFSLFNWDGGINKTFIALQNYIELLKDKNFWQAFWNNIPVSYTHLGQAAGAAERLPGGFRTALGSGRAQQ